MKNYNYAKQIAEHMWAKCYKQDSPNWKPLPDLAGVLSQIDNMVSGMDREVLPLDNPE